MHGLLPIYVRTWRKKICFYSIVMVILGTCLLIFGVLALTETQTEQDILEFLTHMWENKDTPKPEVRIEAEKFWDDVQIEYTCCSLNSVYTYNDVNLPKSCCRIDVNCTVEKAHKDHCLHAVTHYYKAVLHVILTACAFTMSSLCFLFVISAHISTRLLGLLNVTTNDSVL